jgi:mannose-6-phosphate isomerase-like protein (cupin superfamily)
VAERGFALRSVARHDAKLRLYRHGDVEVTVVEIGPGSLLAEASLWESPSWHLVVEGHATFQQGDQSWDILPDESLRLEAGRPYTILNPSAQKLKLLSVTLGSVRTEPGNVA